MIHNQTIKWPPGNPGRFTAGTIACIGEPCASTVMLLATADGAVATCVEFG